MSDEIEGVVALMGLDWASDKHDVQLLEVGAEKPEHLVLKQPPSSEAELAERASKLDDYNVCLSWLHWRHT